MSIYREEWLRYQKEMRQLIISAVKELGSVRAAAGALGISRRAVNRALASIKSEPVPKPRKQRFDLRSLDWPE